MLSIAGQIEQNIPRRVIAVCQDPQQPPDIPRVMEIAKNPGRNFPAARCFKIHPNPYWNQPARPVGVNHRQATRI
jgi:hypothetical protein